MPEEQTIYVSCATSKHIAILKRALSGALREMGRVALEGDNTDAPTSLPLAFSPDRRMLYAALRGQPYPVFSFAIDPASGALTPTGRGVAPGRPAALGVDPSGRWLICASYLANHVSVTPLDGGRTGAAATQVVPGIHKAHSVRFDPSGRFFYVGALADDNIVQMRLDPATGALAIVSRTPAKAGAGPRHLEFDAAGRHLYVVNEQNGSVGAYAVDPDTGGLAELHTLPLVPASQTDTPFAADIHLTPDGRFLYASVRSPSTIGGFAIDPASGRLTPIETVASEPVPRGFAITPDGRQLIAPGQRADRIAVFDIDPATGRLTRADTLAVEGGPSWIEFLNPHA